ALSADRRPRTGAAHAAARLWPHAHRAGYPGPPAMDRAGRSVRGALGVCETEAPGDAESEEPHLDPEPDRRVHPGAAREGRAAARAGGGSPYADPPALARPDRPAALAGGSRRLCQRFVAGCL